MADTDVARELTQRQVLNAALADRALGLREQSRAQIAVVIRALVHSLGSLPERSCR